MTPAQHTAPEAMVEACARAICESLRNCALAADVALELDLTPAYWGDVAQAAIAAISGQIREALLSDPAIETACKAHCDFFGGSGWWDTGLIADTKPKAMEAMRSAVTALISEANHEPR